MQKTPLILIIVIATILLPFSKGDGTARVGTGGRGQSDGNNGSRGESGGNITPLIQKVLSNCTKGIQKCYGIPVGCYDREEGVNCKIIASISKASKEKYHFQLISMTEKDSSRSPPSQPKGSYVAIGLSHNGIGMAMSSIVSCKMSTNGNTETEVSWSETAAPPAPVEGAYVQRNLISSNGPNGLYCSFYRNVNSTEQGHDFYLDHQKYDVLVAKGELDLSEDVSGQSVGKVSYHRTEDRYLFLNGWNANANSALSNKIVNNTILSAFAILAVTMGIFN